MISRFAEFILDASRDSELAALCRKGADREGLFAAMDSYGLNEAERNLVLNAAAPAGTPIVKTYRKAGEIVKAYRKTEDIVKAYRKAEDVTLRA